MAVYEIILSNGDTPEWVRLDFETFSDKGKIIKAFIDVSVGKTARIFDFKRKCWFIQNSVIDAVLVGIKTLIAQGPLSGYTIVDKRVKLESFDEFFNKTDDSHRATPPKSKPELVGEFYRLMANTGVESQWLTDLKVDEAKKMYRKAAMVLHPDRNNGDGAKMSELNKIWAELQAYL